MSLSAITMLFSAVPLTLFVTAAAYVMYSSGLHRMAENTGVKPSWLAWVPCLRLFTLGQLADRYNSSEGKTSIYRVLLPALNIIGWSISFVGGILLSVVYLTGWAGSMFLGAGFAALGGIVALAAEIMELICYYKTFSDYEPEYSVLYLILCLVRLEWVAIFLCRNNVPVGIAGHCRPKQPRYHVYGK